MGKLLKLLKLLYPGIVAVLSFAGYLQEDLPHHYQNVLRIPHDWNIYPDILAQFTGIYIRMNDFCALREKACVPGNSVGEPASYHYEAIGVYGSVICVLLAVHTHDSQ